MILWKVRQIQKIWKPTTDQNSRWQSNGCRFPLALHNRRKITSASFSRDKMYTSETALRRSYRVTCERAQRREMKFGFRVIGKIQDREYRARTKSLGEVRGRGSYLRILPTVIHVVIVGHTRASLAGSQLYIFSLIQTHPLLSVPIFPRSASLGPTVCIVSFL